MQGIFTGSCGIKVDHAVVLVGYDTSDDNTDFWLVKNSWGSFWGEKGYIKILRNINSRYGQCGIARYMTYPVISSSPLVIIFYFYFFFKFTLRMNIIV